MWLVLHITISDVMCQMTLGQRLRYLSDLMLLLKLSINLQYVL